LGALGLLALIPALAGSLPAWAGGVQLVERGVRALGRGGAAIVGADDVNTAYLNPAGLLRLSGLTVSVDSSLIDFAVHHTRTPDPVGGEPGCCDEARSHIDYLNPSAGVAYTPPGGRWAAAFSVFGPYAGAVKFDADGAARYAIVNQANALVYAQATGAYRLHDTLWLGLGLQLRQFRMFQQLAVSVYPGFLGTPEDPQFDALLDIRVDDWFSPGGVAGLIFRPRDWLEIGLSYQTPFDVDGVGSMRSTIPGHYLFADVAQRGDQVRLQTRLPDILRLGVRYRQPERFDLELAAVWERWSDHTTITATPQGEVLFTGVPGIGEYRIRQIAVEDYFQDTLSLRLGGELRLRPDGLRLRAGVCWENATVPDSSVSVGAFDAAKLGIGLGLTAPLGPWELDAGFMHLFLADRHITSSTRRQINPLYPGGDPLEGPTVVGNGSYSGRLDVLSLGFTRRW